MAELDRRPPDHGPQTSSLGQLLRFVVVGSFNTAVSFGIYSLLVWLHVPVQLASLGSLMIGIVISFVLLGKLVFVSQLRGRFHRFLLAWCFLYLLNIGCITMLMRAGTGPYIAGLIAAIITAAASFLVQRNYVFRLR